MLKYFFENRGDNQELFKDLEIYKMVEFKEHVGKYPVIFLSFKDIKSTNPKEALNKVNILIREEFGRHKESILKIIDEDRYNYYDIIQRKATQDVYEKSLKLLSILQEVIILIDEYDTPIHASYLHGYYNEFIEFIRNFLSGAFKDNNYLYKGVITGILRVGRESMFTGLNNIFTSSIVDYEYSNRFGFTVDETKKILADFGLADKYDAVNESFRHDRLELKTINKFREKKYEVEVKKRGYSDILKMGVVFDGKRVWVRS